MESKILPLVLKTEELLSDREDCKNQLEQVISLKDKLLKEDITISIIGQFKRGKSTVSNLILGDDVMPVGIVPITSAVTKVKYGNEKKANVYFQNGAIEEVDFNQLSQYISEQQNKNNILGVKDVVIQFPCDFLKEGLTYVDTPGVGSFHKNNTEVAYDYMKESDGVIFLLSVDSPINQIEIDFLQNAKEFAGKFYFAVNKIDIVEEADLKNYMEYCSDLLKTLLETEDINLMAVSGRRGDGIEALKERILRDTKTSLADILEKSISKKLREIITNTLEQLNFYWKAMNMSYPALDKAFEEIKSYCIEISERANHCSQFFEIELNQIKQSLSQKIYEEFQINYTFPIEERLMTNLVMSKDEFLGNVDSLTKELQESLSTVLLYREENAYKVVRKANDINKLQKELRKIKALIEEE